MSDSFNREIFCEYFQLAKMKTQCLALVLVCLLLAASVSDVEGQIGLMGRGIGRGYIGHGIGRGYMGRGMGRGYWGSGMRGGYRGRGMGRGYWGRGMRGGHGGRGYRGLY